MHTLCSSRALFCRASFERMLVRSDPFQIKNVLRPQPPRCVYIDMQLLLNHIEKASARLQMSACPSFRLSVRPSVRLSVCPSVRPSVCLSIHLFSMSWNPMNPYGSDPNGFYGLDPYGSLWIGPLWTSTAWT